MPLGGQLQGPPTSDTSNIAAALKGPLRPLGPFKGPLKGPLEGGKLKRKNPDFWIFDIVVEKLIIYICDIYIYIYIYGMYIYGINIYIYIYICV